jgi:hypothetical protein
MKTSIQKFLVFSGLCLAIPALASVVILFDPATGRNPRRIDSADTTAYASRTDCVINPILPTNALSLCYVTNGQVVPIPQSWLIAEALSSWLASSNANWNYQRSILKNNMNAALDFFNDNTNTANLVVTALMMQMMDERNHYATNHGELARSSWWYINAIVAKMNLLCYTNQ